jgi:hypothetical protein
MGFSEGEWVGTIAATASGDAAFFVVVSPSGRSPADQVLYEVGAVLRLRGYSEDAIRRAVSLNEGLFEFVRSGADREALEAGLREVREEPWFGAAKLPDELGTAEDWAWWRSVMDFDPVPVWSRLRCPVLLVSGGRDPKSPVEDSQARIQRALAAGGNRNATAHIFPQAEHGLVEWWLPGRLPPPRFPRGYLDLLVNWVASETGTAESALRGPTRGSAAPSSERRVRVAVRNSLDFPGSRKAGFQGGHTSSD